MTSKSCSQLHFLPSPLLDDLKLPVTLAPLLLESSFKDVSSLKIPLDSASIPSALEALGCKIDSSSLLDYEVYF
ncbi:hypothetical protein AZE42_11135 [Rhizopogon vesiculosus]|uniref:Uncharacterized protein n=1 Tax=Rhizopogon vesiculosus TaxID=180088 RepID=A0A1J8RCH8_9AGAM|nr:hypothetical protein AZE42_11135 [Rhizopogon vesiculosus]